MMDWLNKNWKNYIKRGERVLNHVDTVPAFGIVLAIKTFFIGLLLLGLFGLAIWLDGDSPQGFFAIIVPIVLLVCVLWSVVRFYQMLSLKLVLTDSGVYGISGIFLKRVKYIPYKKITDVQISRNLIEQMIGVGSVGISTASGGDVVNGRQMSELTMPGIVEYKGVSEFIFKKIK